MGYTHRTCCIEVLLNKQLIEKLQLKEEITLDSVKESIIGTRGMKVMYDQISIEKPNIVRIRFEMGSVAAAEGEAEKAKMSRKRKRSLTVDEEDTAPPQELVEDDNISGSRGQVRDDVYFDIKRVKALLPDVLVCGINTVTRTLLIQEDEKGDDEETNLSHHLIVEGMNCLCEVLGEIGVDAKKTKTNHIIEMSAVLGIEAARSTIIEEIEKTYSNYGIEVDPRHLMLLADVMCFKGEVLGIQRHGISKMKQSVLMLASFEKTADLLFDAAVHGYSDDVKGVSECIIMGIPSPVGTGTFNILHDDERGKELCRDNSSQSESDLKAQLEILRPPPLLLQRPVVSV